MATSDYDKLKIYREQFRKARNLRDTKDKRALELISLYKQEIDSAYFTQRGNQVASPTPVAMVDSMYSSLTAVDVEPVVNMVGPGSLDVARVAEAAVRHVWREAEVTRNGAPAIKDFLYGPGIGWVKVGYDFEDHEETQPKTVDEIRSEIQGLIATINEAGEEMPDAMTLAALVDPEKSVVITDRDRIVADYVAWNQVYWDPSAQMYRDIEWIGELFYLDPVDMKRNERYREYCEKRKTLKKLDDIQPDTKVDHSGDVKIRPEPDAESDPEFMKVAMVEFWNLTAGTFCHFPLNASDFILYESANPFAMNEDMKDRNPYVMCNLREVFGQVEGVSDMALLEASVHEKNRYRSATINYVERHVPKVLAKKGLFGEQARSALESPDPEVVELELEGDVNDVKPLEIPTLPNEVFGMEMRVDQDMREATGVSELMRGLFPDRKRTATETTEVISASAARQSEKRNRLEDFYTDIAKRILQLIQTYWDVDRIQRIVEFEGDASWEFSADDITAEMSLRCELAPKQYHGPAEREERAMKAINFIGPLIQQMTQDPHIKKVAIWGLREMGFTMAEIREIVPQDEEVNAARQQQTQQVADQAVAQEGATPADVEAAAAEELAGQPSEVVDAAALMGDDQDPTAFVPGI